MVRVVFVVGEDSREPGEVDSVVAGAWVSAGV